MKAVGESGYLRDYGVQLHLVETMEDVAAFLEWLKGPRDGMLCFDTETTGLRPDFDRIRLAQFGDRKHGWAIPYERWSGMVVEVLRNLDEELGLHNSKFDMRQYVHDDPGFEWPWHLTHDTMAMAHLLDPLRSKGLKECAAQLIDPQARAGQRDLEKAMSENDWTWATVPADLPAYWIYGAMDPVLTSHLVSNLLPRIQANEQYKALYDLEMGVTRVVAKMERRGVKVDPAYLQEKNQVLKDYMNQANAWIKDEYGIEPTPVRLRKFFDEQQVPYLEKRSKKTGVQSMDKEVLESIDHPLARTELSIRKAERLSTFYLDKLLELRDENDRVHANFWTMGTRTARMSITDPALQTLPKKDVTIRSGVVPEDGYALVSFDMDQVEARLMAIFSGSKALLDAFKTAAATGGDFFCMIASQVYGETITDKKDPRRQMAKITVYGLIYGGGAETLAANVGVTLQVMERFLQDFFGLYPEVRAMQQELMRLAESRRRTEGLAYVKTPLGRRLVVDDDKDYTATNYLIQSHAAEIMKEKVVLLDTILPPSVHILLLVHDEILLEIPLDQVEELMPMIEQALNEQPEGRYEIPLTWGGEYSTESWGDLVS